MVEPVPQVITRIFLRPPVGPCWTTWASADCRTSPTILARDEWLPLKHPIAIAMKQSLQSISISPVQSKQFGHLVSRNESRVLVATVQVSQPVSLLRSDFGATLRKNWRSGSNAAQDRFDLQDELFHHVLVTGRREDQPSTLAARDSLVW